MVWRVFRGFARKEEYISSKSDYVQLSQFLEIEFPDEIGFFVGRLRKWQARNPKKSREDFFGLRMGARDGNLRPCEVAVLTRVFWDPEKRPRTREDILARL